MVGSPYIEAKYGLYLCLRAAQASTALNRSVGQSGLLLFKYLGKAQGVF